MSVQNTRRGAGAGRAGVAAGLLATTMLAGAPHAHAQTASNRGLQDTKDATTLTEVVVTAQKREENLQDVPISIEALGNRKLDQLNVTEFGDYVKFLPSVSYQTIAPSQTNVYMRGVASGGDGNHSGPQPSVGVYLDEQPVTTIEGALDVHLYDIARVESLAGPQGTLYGASSESGTIRIITNKPDTKGFAAGYDAQINHVGNGDFGGVVEGFVNQPINDKVAVRIVAFDQHDSGYIDNVFGTRTYHIKDADPVTDITIDNKSVARNHYNDVDTAGGRAALKVDLNENWTATASVAGQDQHSYGIFGYDPSVGDLKVTHFEPEKAHDRFYQLALTIEGKINNFDLVYAGGYFQRNVNTQQDYTDYSFFYDTVFGSGAYITDAAGNKINPSQHITGIDKFTKESHEVRISTPKEWRARFTGGLFYERQVHDIVQQYAIDGFDPALSVSNHPGLIWLTDQVRIDRDVAAFGEGSFDITPKLTVNGGVRVFEYRNSLRGFFGYGANFSSHTGESQCPQPDVPYRSAPCKNLDKSVEDVGETYKGNLTYKIDPDKLIYFTASSGYRPGGINRRGDIPYLADFLYNYEVGWKTSFFDRRVRWNGAFFYEQWDNFQFSFLGANGLTQIENAGAAEIKGLESDVNWLIMPGLTLSAAGTYLDASLTKPYCGVLNPDGTPQTVCDHPQSPTGTELPSTPHFKGNATLRYSFPFRNFDAHVQGSLLYEGSKWADLRAISNQPGVPGDRDVLGREKAYASVDVSAGIDKGNATFELYIKNLFDERGDVYRYSECSILTPSRTAVLCGSQHYIIPIQPMTVGLKFGQRF